jgi:hypothetical protein
VAPPGLGPASPTGGLCGGRRLRRRRLGTVAASGVGAASDLHGRSAAVGEVLVFLRLLASLGGRSGAVVARLGSRRGTVVVRRPPVRHAKLGTVGVLTSPVTGSGGGIRVAADPELPAARRRRRQRRVAQAWGGDSATAAGGVVRRLCLLVLGDYGGGVVLLWHSVAAGACCSGRKPYQVRPGGMAAAPFRCRSPC